MELLLHELSPVSTYYGLKETDIVSRNGRCKQTTRSTRRRTLNTHFREVSVQVPTRLAVRGVAAAVIGSGEPHGQSAPWADTSKRTNRDWAIEECLKQITTFL